MRKLFAGAGSLIILALVLGGSLAAAAQTAVPSPVGTATAGTHAIEFVSKIAQHGTVFTITGYLTHIQGVDDTALDTGAAAGERSESSARITFAGTLHTTQAAAVGKQLHAIDAVGTLTFYYHEQGGAQFATDQGFRAGTVIAEAAMRIQDVVAVYAPNHGIASGAGDLIWQSISSFTIAGQPAQLGAVNQSLRLTYTGAGVLTQPTPAVSTIYVAGYGIVE